MRMSPVIALSLLSSCLDRTPETKCEGMEDIEFVEGAGPGKSDSDFLFGDKKQDEGCKVQ